MFNQMIMDDEAKIKRALRQPYCVIHDALVNHYAEEIREELLTTDVCDIQDETTMIEKGQKASDDFKYSRKSIPMVDVTNKRQIPVQLGALFDYLNSDLVLKWMSAISGRQCDYFQGAGTIFRPGDQIASHNDSYTGKRADGKIESRALTFNYWLTKDWLPEYGGRLVWEKPFAEIIPTFNTLVLFLPSQVSDHYVEPVADSVKTPRLAVSGWFMTILPQKPNKLKLNSG